MKIVITFLSLLTFGLLVGNELAVALFIHPVLYSVRDEAHVSVVKPLAKRLGSFMPFWYAISLVLAILQLVMIGRESLLSWWLCCAAAILFGLIIILTIALPVPINNRIAGWDLDHLPADWLSLRRRWDQYHRIRVVLLLLALSMFILSALLNQAPPS